jgi:hypothetical protein
MVVTSRRANGNVSGFLVYPTCDSAGKLFLVRQLRGPLHEASVMQESLAGKIVIEQTAVDSAEPPSVLPLRA